MGACRSGCGVGEAPYSQGRGATRVCETVLIFRCGGIGKGAKPLRFAPNADTSRRLETPASCQWAASVLPRATKRCNNILKLSAGHTDAVLSGVPSAGAQREGMR